MKNIREMDKMTVKTEAGVFSAKVMRRGRKYFWLAVDQNPGLHKFGFDGKAAGKAWQAVSAGIDAELRKKRDVVRKALPSLTMEQLDAIGKIIDAVG